MDQTAALFFARKIDTEVVQVLADTRIAQLERELAEARELARMGGWSK